MAQSGRHRRISRGHSSRIMRYQSQPDPVIPNINIWMVPGIFSHRGNPVYEVHCGYEILESPLADQFAIRKNPKRFVGKKI